MICKRCDHTEHVGRCMVSIGLPGDYQPCGCQPASGTVYGIRPHRPMTEQENAAAKRLAETTELSGEALEWARSLANETPR